MSDQLAVQAGVLALGLLKVAVPLAIALSLTRLGRATPSPVWYTKELWGALAAAIATVPFSVAFYPEVFNIRSIPLEVWVLRNSIAMGVAALVVCWLYTIWRVDAGAWPAPDDRIGRRLAG